METDDEEVDNQGEERRRRIRYQKAAVWQESAVESHEKLFESIG